MALRRGDIQVNAEPSMVEMFDVGKNGSDPFGGFDRTEDMRQHLEHLILTEAQKYDMQVKASNVFEKAQDRPELLIR